MKKKRFLMIIGLLVLALVTTVAVKAYARFTVVQTLYYTDGVACKTFTVAATTVNFKTFASGIQAKIVGLDGISYPLWASCSAGAGSNPVYFQP